MSERRSNFAKATHQGTDERCPHCGAQDIPGASPTLEREQNGTLTCRTCSCNFTPKKEQ
jgi:transcription elongation factor Elf1